MSFMELRIPPAAALLRIWQRYAIITAIG